MPSVSDSPAPVPPPVPVETHPYRAAGLKSPAQPRALPDPSRLAPEDAYCSQSLTRIRTASEYDESIRVLNGTAGTVASAAALRPPPAVPGRKEVRKVRGTSRRRRRKGAWKKLLWVKQSYHLQRNPRVRPYDFWPLVADSTVIVQHEQGEVLHAGDRVLEGDDGSSSSSMTSSGHPSGVWPNGQQHKDTGQVHGLGLSMSNESGEPLGRSSAVEGNDGAQEPASPSPGQMAGFATRPDTSKSSLLSARNRQRLSTVKSAFLIYCALLGLSPILKSLTKSTASDSIWTLSCWLLIINIFSITVDQRGSDGVDGAGITAPVDDARVQPDAVLDGGVRAVPHLPTAAATHLLDGPCTFDAGSGDRGGWGGGDHAARRMGSGGGGIDLGQHLDCSGDGGMQLVADQSPEVQERGDGAMGSGSADHSTMGLTDIDT
ncbi:hypothetical protein EYZ11_006752 [Aspergillus tanneri]|uniref:Uncharacterized protein n=1 Tax=Aspergillus tanneri TaxID=1220188 RepID=A0A4S3JF72_9EURO|nr:hypothetical protein EYZ11_006752 [Aspergillus tanneri]